MNHELTRNFQVVRLAKGDAKHSTDHLRTFKELILSNEQMYPKIGDWYKERVVPGIKSSERTAFIGYVNESPIVSAVVKLGEHAKFCHLKIREDFRDSHLGELFFCLMALEVRRVAKDVHFTLPESLWQTKGEFFKSFNFATTAKADTQYRLFDDELHSSAVFSSVWGAVLSKLPKLSSEFLVGGHSLDNDLLMSVKPDYADRILSGQKTVEIRRRFSERWAGRRISLYASAPLMSLVGEATIAQVVLDSPEVIWDKYRTQIACSRDEYDVYSNGKKEVFAVVLEGVRPYRGLVTLSYMSNLVREALIPPQSYCTLEAGKPWAKAVSIATMLHGLRGSGYIQPKRYGNDICTRKYIESANQLQLL